MVFLEAPRVQSLIGQLVSTSRVGPNLYLVQNVQNVHEHKLSLFLS